MITQPCPGELYKMRLWSSTDKKRWVCPPEGRTKFVLIISEHYVPHKTHGTSLCFDVLIDGSLKRFNITQFTKEHSERIA